MTTADAFRAATRRSAADARYFLEDPVGELGEEYLAQLVSLFEKKRDRVFAGFRDMGGLSDATLAEVEALMRKHAFGFTNINGGPGPDVDKWNRAWIPLMERCRAECVANAARAAKPAAPKDYPGHAEDQLGDMLDRALERHGVPDPEDDTISALIARGQAIREGTADATVWPDDDLDSAVVSPDGAPRPPTLADVVDTLMSPFESQLSRTVAKAVKARVDAEKSAETLSQKAWVAKQAAFRAEQAASAARETLAKARSTEKAFLDGDKTRRASLQADREELTAIVAAVLRGEEVPATQSKGAGTWRLKDGRLIDSKGRDFKLRHDRYQGA